MNIVHLYAEEYGWTKDYILENVYLDEHIINEKIIKQQRQQDLDVKTQLTLLPVIQDDKDRANLLNSLNNMYVNQEQIQEINENITINETKKQVQEAKKKLANL